MLEESRPKVHETVAVQMDSAVPDLEEVRKVGEKWYEDLKEWEVIESWPRAFKDNRMTSRNFDPDAKIKEIPVGPEKIKIQLDTGLQGIKGRLDPNNFINKLKNEKGLHDLPGGVLRGDRALSRQLFKVSKGVIFMPLPLEEDLQTLYLLSSLAKQHRESALYKSYVKWRSNITHLKYGSDNDMMAGFLVLPKTKPNSTELDGTLHVRYGMANITGKAFDTKTLALRVQNALNYKTAIALSNNTQENNEVVISYRQHPGYFPWLGVPAELGSYRLFSVTSKQLVGTLSDNGDFSPV